MKRLYLSVIALGAGVAVLGGVAAVQAARKAMTQQERTQVRLQRQQRLGKHVRNRCWHARVRPGDGSGRHDAGREHVHGARHVTDDCCDGWCLPGW